MTAAHDPLYTNKLYTIYTFRDAAGQVLYLIMALLIAGLHSSVLT